MSTPRTPCIQSNGFQCVEYHHHLPECHLRSTPKGHRRYTFLRIDKQSWISDQCTLFSPWSEVVTWVTGVDPEFSHYCKGRRIMSLFGAVTWDTKRVTQFRVKGLVTQERRQSRSKSLQVERRRSGRLALWVVGSDLNSFQFHWLPSLVSSHRNPTLQCWWVKGGKTCLRRKTFVFQINLGTRMYCFPNYRRRRTPMQGERSGSVGREGVPGSRPFLHPVRRGAPGTWGTSWARRGTGTLKVGP